MGIHDDGLGAPVKLPLLDAAKMLDRSITTFSRWRERGCPGFERTENGRVLVDVLAVQRWARETKASKPGPKLGETGR